MRSLEGTVLSVATIQQSVNEFLGLYFMHIEQEKRLSAIMRYANLSSIQSTSP
jgi:hypothetical protein